MSCGVQLFLFLWTKDSGLANLLITRLIPWNHKRETLTSEPDGIAFYTNASTALEQSSSVCSYDSSLVPLRILTVLSSIDSLKVSWICWGKRLDWLMRTM